MVVGCMALLIGAALCLPLISAPLLRAVGAALSPLAQTAPVAAAALARRRRRTALTLAGLVVSVATATALSALSSGAVTAGDRWVTQMFVGDIVVHSPATQSASIAQLVAATPGVREVTPVPTPAPTPTPTPFAPASLAPQGSAAPSPQPATAPPAPLLYTPQGLLSDSVEAVLEGSLLD
ncbi:MAG: hypothetical protein E6I76_14265 [Chloroflexi bacterium]|nr:MAG: hypothetical protein E6I76_14265 [Chloroflexota bacterium]